MILEKNIEDYLKYLGLSGSEDIFLRSINKKMDERFKGFIENFYSRLDKFGISEEFFKDPNSLERLKKAQKEHFKELLSGPYDETFLESRKKVGKTHDEKKISPDIYLGAYTQFFTFITKILFEENYQEPMNLQKNILSIFKIFMLDITIIMNAYHDSFNDDLGKKNIMLKDLSEEKARFFKIVIHDLRNPLNIIFNYTKLIEEIIIKNELMDDKTESKFSHIHNAVNKLVKMSQDIFQISDLGNVDLKANREKINPAPELTNIIKEFKDLVEEKNLSLDIKIAPEVGNIFFEGSALRDIYNNLISNAIKFSKKGGKIEIGLKHAGDSIGFMVKDYGVGISIKEIGDLFDPEIKKSSKPTADEIGSGFGLYIVEKIVNSYEGRIEVKSEKGQGLQITVFLPKAPK